MIALAFLEYKDSRCGLGYWTDQAFEAIHCDYKKFWLRKKNGHKKSKMFKSERHIKLTLLKTKV